MTAYTSEESESDASGPDSESDSRHSPCSRNPWHLMLLACSYFIKLELGRAEDDEIVFRALVSLGGRALGPADCLGDVLLDSFSARVRDSLLAFRVRVALVGGKPI